MKDCNYLEGVKCTYEHELTKEDCIVCMPHIMITHAQTILSAICNFKIEFGHAKNIYAASDRIQKAQIGLIKLMTEEYPEIMERAKIQKHGDVV